MNLSKALRLPTRPVVALVGAGGKTTALVELARELRPSLATTTTHLGAWQVDSMEAHLVWDSHSPMPDLESTSIARTTLVTGEREGDRFPGLTAPQLALLKEKAQELALPLLIEADGARGKPLKAPAGHEPSLPEFVNLVIVVAGLSGLGKPLGEEHVHRAEIFADLSGIRIGDPVGLDDLARVLTHPAGGLKNIPAGARRIALLNQADTVELQSQGQRLAELILPFFDAVVLSALDQGPAQGRRKGKILAVHEQIAAVLLAAGASTRFGAPKQLLDFHGKPFVRVISETARTAGLEPVVVVTGAQSDQVESALQGLPVKVVHNPEWRSGQGSSIRSGLSALPHGTGAAIFLLADQPQVTVSVLRALVERHAQDLPAVLAPYVLDRRANPVLFDQTTFADLLLLQGDQGGRAIFSKFPPTYWEWADEHLLFDVDTPEDYRRLLEREDGP